MMAGNLLTGIFAVLFIGIVSVVFAISFAAIIYTGELAAYFDRGIGLALMGSTVLAIVGAFSLSYRGSILQPQDVPAILLAGAVATLVSQRQLSGEVLFATVACLISVVSIATGLTAIMVGKMKLAMLARYIPYPVLAGFLAATGLLLLIGGVGVAVGMSPGVGNLPEFFKVDALLKWIPTCIGAAGIVFAVRRFDGDLTLPLSLIVTAIAFYAIITSLGLSLLEARASGFLLGPFNSGSFMTGIGPQTLAQADWGAILSQVPVIVTVVAISLIGTTLNASGLELELGQDLDINQEVLGVGWANSLSGLLGGLPGYHLLGETILANRLGLMGPIAGISSAAGCLAVLLLGGTVLSFMPVGLFATVIAFLGLDLLYTWLWGERHKLKASDYTIVVFIPIVAVTFSFLTAIAAGLIVAFCFFVVTYAKLDIVRFQSNLASRRSFVERSDDEVIALGTLGEQAHIIELSGYLFFASASLLRDRVQILLGNVSSQTYWLIMDFKHVSGMDISAWHMLQRLSTDCEQRNVCVLISGIDHIATVEKATVAFQFAEQSLATLDQALESVENTLLAKHAHESEVGAFGMFTEILTPVSPGLLDRYIKTVSAEAGDLVIERGMQSNEIYILQYGLLAVSVVNDRGAAVIVAKIKPGSVFGEMAYYTGRERTADVIAEGPIKLLRIDMGLQAALEQEYPLVAAKFHKLVAQHMALRFTCTTRLLRDLEF